MSERFRTVPASGPPQFADYADAKPAPPEGPSLVSWVSIGWDSSMWGQVTASAIRVVIDDDQLGLIERGAIETFEVIAGHHVVWCFADKAIRSNELGIYNVAGETVSLQCRPTHRRAPYGFRLMAPSFSDPWLTLSEG